MSFRKVCPDHLATFCIFIIPVLYAFWRSLHVLDVAALILPITIATFYHLMVRPFLNGI